MLRALELLPEEDITERERLKAIIMKAKKGIQEQTKALDKRKASMQKAFAAPEGGIGDSRVKPNKRPKISQQMQSKPSQRVSHILKYGSILVVLISLIAAYFLI